MWYLPASWSPDRVEVALAPRRVPRFDVESEGIPVLLKGEGIDAPYPTGPVYVFVPASFEARAPQLFDEDT